jgi:hypothetical protein
MAQKTQDREFPSRLTVTASTSRFFPVAARVVIGAPKAGLVNLDVIWEDKHCLRLVQDKPGAPPQLDCELTQGGHHLLATLGKDPDGRQVLFGCVISRPSIASGATGVWVAEADREDPKG